MKKLLVSFIVAAACLFGQGQTLTPNIGLAVPSYGQTNYQVPLQYDLNLLDLYLSGNKPIPALTVTGTLSAPGFLPSSSSIISGLGYTPAADPGSNGLVYRTATGASVPIAFPLVTKGDIFTWSSSPLGPARLPVGTDGQVPIADSSQAIGIRWGTNGGGSGTFPVTTKGDLFTFGSSAARLPVGADGQVPIADSTQTLGIRWGAISSSWAANPLDYNFTAITPGGSLTTSVPVTISIPFAPKGVNGTNTNPYYMYVSGGTGAAEGVRITGGSCVSGTAGTCTLQFTPANSHSGAWTISSASNGLQESLNIAGNVLIPWNATLSVHAPVTPPTDATIQGAGPTACNINYDSPNKILFNVLNDRFSLRHCSLVETVTGVSGNVAIRTFGPLAVSAGTSRWGELVDIFISGSFYNDVIVEGNGQLFNAQDLQVANAISDGITLLGAQGYWNNITAENGQGNGIVLGHTAAFGGTIAFMSNIQTFNNAGWGIISTTTLYIAGGNTYLNNDKLGELLVNTPSADAGYFRDANVQFAGQSITWGTQTNSPGIEILAGTGPFVINNIHCFNTQGNCLLLNSTNTSVGNSTIVGAGLGGIGLNVYSIATSNCDQCRINSVTTDTAMLLNGSGMIITDNTMSVASSLTGMNISGGTDVILANNYLKNAGSGPALGLNTGVTYQHGVNTVIGSVNNLGAASTHSSPL